MKILLPVDGSAHSDRATRHVIRQVQGCANQEVLLLNVQEPIDAPEVRSHLPAREIEAMQESRGGDALESARALLDSAGLAYTSTVEIGRVAETIARYARDNACDSIVMGTHGAGVLESVLMGSITKAVISQTDRPVTVVH